MAKTGDTYFSSLSMETSHQFNCQSGYRLQEFGRQLAKKTHYQWTCMSHKDN